MPPPHWEPIAIQHASTVANYLILHGESAEYLATDPTKRDRMLKELANSNAPWVRKQFKYDANEDVDELLRGWDDAIAKTPVTLEELVTFGVYGTRIQRITVISIGFTTQRLHSATMSATNWVRMCASTETDFINFLKTGWMKSQSLSSVTTVAINQPSLGITYS